MPSPKEKKSENRTTERNETNPHRIFEKLFDCYHFHEITGYLHDIKEWLVNRNYPYQPESREHDNTMFFFEKMLELVEAVQVLEKQRQAEELQLDKDTPKAPQIFHALFDKVDALYDAAIYLHQRKQNGLSCYFLQKDVLCIYNSLLISTSYDVEETPDLEELARSCSRIFDGLPNPFNPGSPGDESLKLLSSMTLQRVFSTDDSFENEQMEILFRQVAIIRKDVCEYYEREIQRSGDD